LTLTNHDWRAVDLELTSYAEVVLLGHRGDVAHPAFGKLFLETEWLPGPQALLCRRRPRSAEQQPVYAVHVSAVESPQGAVEYETDRARFLGRGRTPARPAALEPGSTLSGTTGPVLDPVFSLRRRVRVAPGTSVTVAFTTAVASTREEALALADRYHDLRGVTRAFELAWAHTQVQLRHLHLSAEEAHLFQRLAAHVLYAGPALRASPEVLRANRQGQPGLWKHGISGDRPIVLVRVAAPEELALPRQALLAHAYWRLQGLEVDLVTLNEHAGGYQEELQQQLQTLVRGSDSHALVDRPGGVFLRKADQLSEEDRTLLLAAARVVLVGWQGSLAAQVDRPERPLELPPARPGAQWPPVAPMASAPSLEGLRFANGRGGFGADGGEYVIALPGAAARAGALPPAPWVNVIANPNAGFLVSEGGSGYTWAGNSQTNRLTPWTNDPVSDPPGEVLYLRDEATGAVWTPTPLPLGGPCKVRHGHGYSVFESSAQGLSTELTLGVPPADPVKLILLKVRNTGDRPRRLSATFYAEWVLGTSRDLAPMQVLTELDEDGALLARNPFNADFSGGVAFADVSVRPRGVTADRTEFLGRNGSVLAPAALRRVGLSGRVGAGIDPCATLLAPFELQPGEGKEIVFVLGESPSAPEARRLAAQYRNPDTARAALDSARQRWKSVLGALTVRTPNPELDVLVNGWLLYQALSCRVWGRSALYQSGGAYGFRDQLQDVLALAHVDPAETRAQILRAASRQFPEGDVQHWWHPPLGRGVRTRISDDLVWLPYAVCHYVGVTGDESVLDEKAPFLRGPLLRPDQEEDYGLPQPTEEELPVYEHCARALEHALRFGAHGLPLMGTGDWNDGMNRVGAEGKGESVWNAWFLLAVLPRFADLSERRGDPVRAERYRAEAEELRAAAEEAWDGAWYRRAYFDDGTPLGSAQNDECQIDAIAQSWGVISGAAEPGRARQAMRSVDERLVDREARLIRLFTPPFDHGGLNPGYIKGYVPGIRENGGQYTHAATWTVLATALLGEGTRAVELFDLLNPVRHSSSPEQVALYKVEPYVVAADVYGVPPHTGRGGWTWYTGSAGWLYRVAVEGLLGFHKEGDHLRIDPCVARDWGGFELTYRHGTATYHVVVGNPGGVERGVRGVTLDGNPVADGAVPLADDGGTHEVRVTMG
jgi:cyclic beta-1,2-glucan synthetase